MIAEKTCEADPDPDSCRAVQLVTEDMGNGVVRISRSKRVTAAEVKAFVESNEVMLCVELEDTQGLMAVAFSMAGLVRPLAYAGAIRPISDMAREVFIWAV